MRQVQGLRAEELAGWGLTPPVVVADAGYGQSHPFRDGLRDRGQDYITAVRGDTSAHPADAVPSAPERAGRNGAHRLPCPPAASDSTPHTPNGVR
ncbi:transposase [Streptomyces sp. TRM68367]|nr:transposase [Streptomyces sp. TRM68367]